MSISSTVAGGIALAAFVLLGVFLFWARRAGGDAVKKAIGERDVEAAKRIAEGAVDKPRSRDELADRVRDGW